MNRRIAPNSDRPIVTRGKGSPKERDHGLMVQRSLQLTEISDFAELLRDEANGTCVWFKFKTMMVGGYYLPPSLDFVICRESLLIALELVEDQNQNVFPAGGLDLRMGSLVGNSIKDSRTRLWDTAEEVDFYWLQLDEGSEPYTQQWVVPSLTTCLRTHMHGGPLKVLRSSRLSELRAQIIV